MKVVYPKDTPPWLIEMVDQLQEAATNQLLSGAPSLENLLVARGASKVVQKLCEEIDCLGRAETSNDRQLAEEATKRG
jgi:hypothetical protein